MKIGINNVCADFLEKMEVPQIEVLRTVGEPDSGVLDTDTGQGIAVRWLDDDRLIFAEGHAKGRAVDGGIQIEEFLVMLAIELRPNLPGGTITRELDARDVRMIVAESFGLPIQVPGSEKEVYLVTGVGNVDVPHDPSDSLCAMVGQRNGLHWNSWIFSMNRYRSWFQGAA